MLHAIDKRRGRDAHRFRAAVRALQEFLRRRGLVVAISDFWEQPEKIIKTVEPLRFRGNELVLFHVLDPEEIRPKLRHPVLLEDLETGRGDGSVAGLHRARVSRIRWTRIWRI